MDTRRLNYDFKVLYLRILELQDSLTKNVDVTLVGIFIILKKPNNFFIPPVKITLLILCNSYIKNDISV